MELYELPDELRRQAEAELEAKETVRWLGQPEPRGFPRGTLFPVLFAIPWTLFSLFWMAGAAGFFPGMAGPGQGQGAPPMFQLLFAAFGLPFVCIGVAMLSSPWWMRRSIRQRAAKTAYLITDRRAIVMDGGFAGAESQQLQGMMFFGGFPFSMKRGELHIRSFRPDQLSEIERVQRSDSSGDVILQKPRSSGWLAIPGMTADPPVGFFAIPHVRDVERLLRDLRETAEIPNG